MKKPSFIDRVRSKLVEMKEKREREEHAPVSDVVTNVSDVPRVRSAERVKIVSLRLAETKDSLTKSSMSLGYPKPHYSSKGSEVLVLKKRERNGKVEYYYDVE